MINDDTPAFADAMEAEAAVRATLERLILKSGDGYAALSRLIGRNPAYIQQYLRRGVPRRLSEDDRHRLARHFGVSEVQLGARTAAARTLSPDSSQHRAVEVGWLANAEAGAAGLLLDEGLLQRIAGGRHDWLAAHLVQGDSMAPTLLDGDHVLVDTADRQPLRDGLYAIESESRPVLKRLSINPATQLVAILSDNAAYPSFPDCDPAQIRVIGRVVWLGRRQG
jgi:hypothetical protein